MVPYQDLPGRHQRVRIEPRRRQRGAGRLERLMKGEPPARVASSGSKRKKMKL